MRQCSEKPTISDRAFKWGGGEGDKRWRLLLLTPLSSTSPGSSNCTHASLSEKACPRISASSSNSRSLQNTRPHYFCNLEVHHRAAPHLCPQAQPSSDTSPVSAACRLVKSSLVSAHIVFAFYHFLPQHTIQDHLNCGSVVRRFPHVRREKNIRLMPERHCYFYKGGSLKGLLT